jgi:hypothetical protein
MLARFRPTPRQAAARGGVAGAVAGAVLAVLLAASHLTAGVAEWWLVAVAFAVPLAAGAVLGPAFIGESGADVDDLGIHRAPANQPALAPWRFAPWRGIVDIRAERRGPRTVVAVYLDSGVMHQLAAPYDGRLLAGDPDFERKLFTLRNLWETHRSWEVHG